MPNDDNGVLSAAVLKTVADTLGQQATADLNRKNWAKTQVDVEHSGTKIVLPAEPRPMDEDSAIEALQRRKKAQAQKVEITEHIEGFPFDAAVAFLKAMERTYGWASPVPTPGFFGSRPPSMLTVKTGPKPEDFIQVPVGSFVVPGVEGPIQTGVFGGGFYLNGQIRNSERQVIADLAAKARKILREESIYRGKSIRIPVDDEGKLDVDLQPEFLETDHVKVEELILNEDVMALLTTALFTPIQQTDRCLELGVPLKRGILLGGKYGTGKSMSAAVTSKLCVENGWTYILLDDATGLRAGLEFAKKFQPAVLFAEDIDRVTEQRDNKANDLLNTLDGVLSKDSQVLTVVTTNHVEKINKAMLRPGRLDTVVQFVPPNAEAAARLIRQYARGLVTKDETLNRIGQELAGQIPATIREVVERSKLAMIARGGSLLSEDDLLVAAVGMRHHLQLLNGEPSQDESPEKALGTAMARVVRAHTNGHDKELDFLARGVEALAERFDVEIER